MRCHDVRKQLDLFVRQDVTPGVADRIEAHLADCPACREARNRLVRLALLLESVAAPPVPEGFAARVVMRAQRLQPTFAASARRPAGNLGRRLRHASAIATALAIGVLLGGFLGQGVWSTDDRPAAVGPSDPSATSEFRQLHEPGGDLLAHAYLGLVSRKAD
ncbi:MAG TPA: hypothetical protein DD670_16740 [Planctomycetaceae bacterium]|nr:hypothetical protein [Planctomycetaceae bacterium]